MENITLVVDEKHYVLAYVAYDADKKWTVVSFRATICGDFYKDIRVDSNVLLVPY